MSEKTQKKIDYLETSIKVRDVIIKWLLNESVKQSIKLPKELTENISTLYGVNSIKKEDLQ